MQPMKSLFMGLCNLCSLFTSHPDIQSTFFPMMSANDIVTLGSHGSKIVLAIGGLVHTVRDDDASALAVKLRMVNIPVFQCPSSKF